MMLLKRVFNKQKNDILVSNQFARCTTVYRANENEVDIRYLTYRNRKPNFLTG